MSNNNLGSGKKFSDNHGDNISYDSLNKSSKSSEIYGELKKPVKALKHRADVEIVGASRTTLEKIELWNEIGLERNWISNEIGSLNSSRYSMRKTKVAFTNSTFANQRRKYPAMESQDISHDS
jgi:hypothetical protein